MSKNKEANLRKSEEELKMENLIRTYERTTSNLFQFNRIENDRIYLGFTLDELDEVLKSLERNCYEDNVQKRFTALFLAFTKFRSRMKWWKKDE